MEPRPRTKGAPLTVLRSREVYGGARLISLPDVDGAVRDWGSLAVLMIILPSLFTLRFSLFLLRLLLPFLILSFIFSLFSSSFVYPPLFSSPFYFLLPPPFTTPSIHPSLLSFPLFFFSFLFPILRCLPAPSPFLILILHFAFLFLSVPMFFILIFSISSISSSFPHFPQPPFLHPSLPFLLPC